LVLKESVKFGMGAALDRRYGERRAIDAIKAEKRELGST